DVDAALDGVELQASGAAADEDLAADGLDGDVGGGALDGRVREGAGDADRHPGGDLDAHVVGAAPAAALGAEPQDAAGGADVEAGPVGGDADGIAVPGADDDLAGDVLDVEPGALADGNGGVRLLGDAQHDDGGAEE